MSTHAGVLSSGIADKGDNEGGFNYIDLLSSSTAGSPNSEKPGNSRARVGFLSVNRGATVTSRALTCE